MTLPKDHPWADLPVPERIAALQAEIARLVAGQGPNDPAYAPDALPGETQGEYDDRFNALPNEFPVYSKRTGKTTTETQTFEKTPTGAWVDSKVERDRLKAQRLVDQHINK